MTTTSRTDAKTRPRPAVPGTRQALPQGDWHVLDWLNTFYKYRRPALAVVGLVLLAALVRSFTTTPLYRATARLLIELEDEPSLSVVGPPSPNAYWQDPDVYYNTQYQILTGRDLATRIVGRLDLSRIPEFNGQATTRSIVDTVRRLLPGSTAESRAAPAAPDELTLAAMLAGRVSVAPVGTTRLVDVGFTSADPELAARAINMLAEEFVVQNLERRRQNVARSLEWIAEEIARQEAKVEASERALAQYREDQNALSLEDRQNIVVARLNQLNDAALRAKTTRIEKESLYRQVEAVTPSRSPEAIPAVLLNPSIQALKTRLVDLQQERTTLLQRYGEKYPDVVKVNASIADAVEQLQGEQQKAIESFRNGYLAAVAQEESLTAALDEQKEAALDLNRKSASYTLLEREAESNRDIFQTLLRRQNELQVLASSRGNNAKLMDRAVVPGAPFTPNTRRDLSMALLVGLALAVGLVLVLDYLDDTVKTPEDITKTLHVPFLGMVPKIPTTDHPLLNRRVPHEFGEAFRSLRTALAFSNGAQKSRVIMVTSSQPLEGKTTTACNLAAALALGHARVLLVDGDMRRPGVHRALGLRNTVGLSDLLAGQTTARDAVQRVDSQNLWVMTSGTLPPNPSELLSSGRMQEMLDQACNGPFDWVIVDTPPVTPVTDAVVIAPMASAVAFVIRSEMTHRRLAERALETLKGTGVRSLGVVLNQVDLRRNKYYYSRHYGYRNNGKYYTTSHAA